MAKRLTVADTAPFAEREGLAPEPQMWEDGRRLEPTPGTFEWWYLDAGFDDGSTVVAVLSTKSRITPHTALTPLAELRITRPDGTQLGELISYPSAQFQAATGHCDMRIGPNRLEGDLHRYLLHMETGSLAADLELTGLVPPWRPGAGKLFFDDALTRYFAWLPSVPSGAIKGTLTFDGQSRHVQGTGYHDHNWGTVNPVSGLSYWYWGRAHVGEFTLVFVQLVASKAYGRQQSPLFMLAQGNRIITGDGHPLRLATGSFAGRPTAKRYPTELSLDWQTDLGAVQATIRQRTLIESADLLIFFPMWQRLLARVLFIRPHYFRFIGDIELSVDLDGIRATERGAAVYELMIMR